MVLDLTSAPRVRLHASAVGVVLVLLIALTGIGSAPASAATTALAPSPAPLTIRGVDLHDGHLARFGSTYYLYGTMYACGFSWGTAGTPWCGFGVSTSKSLSGPWSTPTQLFGASEVDPWTGTSWAEACGGTGSGCFNPRMIRRSGWGPDDGAFILWFNSPADYNRNHANAYNAMGCNGPSGPCGPGAGAPYGSYRKPSLGICTGDGDFAIIANPAGRPAIVCTMPDARSLSIEELDDWGTDGDNVGARRLAGLGSIESPGGYFDRATGEWILTYSDPGCGYCTGTGTGYATAPDLMGPWSTPDNVGAAAPSSGRRDLSATSCGGQPRTVSVVDGQAWQGIDLWTGEANEAAAGLHFEPLVHSPSSGAAGDGGLWRPPFNAWSCS